MNYLTSNADKLGLSAADVTQSIVTDQYTDSNSGMTHIYLRQALHDLPVNNANLNINVAADGRILNVGSEFVAGRRLSELTPSARSCPCSMSAAADGTASTMSCTRPASASWAPCGMVA